MGQFNYMHSNNIALQCTQAFADFLKCVCVFPLPALGYRTFTFHLPLRGGEFENGCGQVQICLCMQVVEGVGN